ncbi:uncharacterized protein E0L32_002681 [Thyridium curvatum]|uniref:tRNA (guanine(9)-N1)-methyltransferase n=1 Tax=Thyridium curvatum TaxID=1093900 RepID=A0A507B780_9PEZI|nr:uncharacterized protein E0L32_002681 [Thyridium curvatum]TPX18172.1 hypothetical protein E0L32_002681 [Thyridium curvatum]
MADPAVLENQQLPPLATENGDRGPVSEVSAMSQLDQDMGEVDVQQPREAPRKDGIDPPTLSKSQLKKLKRRQLWEEQKEDRKVKRKEKRHSQRARKRAERDVKIAEAKAAGLDPLEVLRNGRPTPHPKWVVPLTLIIDCDFEKYMSEKELVSLSSQITRSYSDNRLSKYQTHLFLSSWKGFLKTRYETVLHDNHKRWKNTYTVEGDFLEAAKAAHTLMKGADGGTLPEILKQGSQHTSIKGDADSTPVPEPEIAEGDASVVYLTSDSPYTLERLEPYTSYVIGGIVDKNREKGLCYKIAREKGVRTAKLPIGEYMIMASRQVLTTNQVVEIMTKWLEFGDWGVAFDAAIPKRKGGKLRSASEDQDEEGAEDDGEVDAEDGENNGDEAVEVTARETEGAADV